MTQMTKTQADLIGTARTREDGALLPAPAGITGKAFERALEALVKKGLVARAPWVADETEDTASHFLTDAGRAAVVLDAAPVAEDGATQERPGGKLGVALKAVERKRGATLADLTEATGWQPHTARAAMTRLRQRGFPAVLLEEDGRKAYRLQG